MAFKLIEKPRVDYRDKAKHICLQRSALHISVNVDFEIGDRVALEVDKAKALIRFVRTKSPWAFTVVRNGRRGKVIQMNSSRHKKMDMPFGYYLLEKKDGDAFTFAKVRDTK